MSNPEHTVVDSPIDQLTLVAEDGHLTGLYFETVRHEPDRTHFGERVQPHENPVLEATARQLGEYFAGKRHNFELPLLLHGDTFSKQVWRMLLEIPYGETVTYGSIARSLGNVALSQRVGQTVGRNPISVIVPCHRVLGADGSLTGFGGGLERKRALLALEEPPAAQTDRLF